MFITEAKDTVKIHLLKEKDLKSHALAKKWEAIDFKAQLYQYDTDLDQEGNLKNIYAGLESADEDLKGHQRLAAHLAQNLPKKFIYEFQAPKEEQIHYDLFIGWALGQYAFLKLKNHEEIQATTLFVPEKFQKKIYKEIDAVFAVRDWVNLPANELHPESFSKRAAEIANKHGAKFKEIKGDDLLKENFPTIHAVGRASTHEPRLIELRWGKEGAPKISLVGKAVCFDTGGYDIKPSRGIRNMKKDMGGGAVCLSLANWIMSSGFDVDLQVLIPMVENRISENSILPGDIIKTRKGISVEIDNTDAEGRLILCDALAYASERDPELIVDFATLTGAARVALGPELPAFFTANEEWASSLYETSLEARDPLWRLPLWEPYQSMLKSTPADMTNSGGSFAGAITAALYLKNFVNDASKWLHVDTYCWSDDAKLGAGGSADAQSLRALYYFLEKTYKN